MIAVLNEGRIIKYTNGDSFELIVTADEADDNTMLRFIVSIDETSQPLIDEQFQYQNGKFIITLTDTERNSLEIGNYIFKILLISGSNKTTELSGDFIVMWGVEND